MHTLLAVRGRAIPGLSIIISIHAIDHACTVSFTLKRTVKHVHRRLSSTNDHNNFLLNYTKKWQFGKYWPLKKSPIPKISVNLLSILQIYFCKIKKKNYSGQKSLLNVQICFDRAKRNFHLTKMWDLRFRLRLRREKARSGEDMFRLRTSEGHVFQKRHDSVHALLHRRAFSQHRTWKIQYFWGLQNYQRKGEKCIFQSWAKFKKEKLQVQRITSTLPKYFSQLGS